MVICAVLKCGNRSGRDKQKRFFRLPAVLTHLGTIEQELSQRRQVEWLARIKRKDIREDQYSNTRVCSDHFISGSPAGLHDETNPDWIASLNLGYADDSLTMKSVRAISEKYARTFERSKKQSIADVEPESPVAAACAEAGNNNKLKSVCMQTDLSIADLEMCARLHQCEIERLQHKLDATEEENTKLIDIAEKSKQELEYSLPNEENFKDNNEKVLYYIGLSTWELLKTLFDYVESYLKKHSSLSPFQQLFLTLMRLRLNLNGKDLGYRFGVHESTVCRTFEFVIDMLYAKLKHLIIWPTRDALKKTMPMVFRKHTHVVLLS